MAHWSNGPVTLHTSHVLTELVALPAGSVQCVVTSPPYWGLRDYGLEPVIWDAAEGCQHEWGDMVGGLLHENRNFHRGTQEEVAGAGPLTAVRGDAKNIGGAFCLCCGAWGGSLGLEPTPQFYVQHLVAVMREVRRVLRDDGVCFLNLGDSYAGSAMTGGPASSSSLVGTHHSAREGARFTSKPRALEALKPKDLVGIPWRVALALQDDGWWLRSDIIWAKPNPMPESVTDRPTRSHEYIFLLTKAETYYWDQEAVREEGVGYGYQQNKFRDGKYLNGRAFSPDSFESHTKDTKFLGGGRNLRSVWTISTQPYSGAHFATFPEALVERCILAGTSEHGCCPECGAPWERVVERGSLREDPQREGRNVRNVGNLAIGADSYSENGGTLGLVRERVTSSWRPTCIHADLTPAPCLVLDPFSGAGTVALVAQKLGRRAIGIELNPKYNELAVKRLEAVPLPMGGG